MNIPKLDFAKVVGEIIDFVRGEVKKSGASGVVLGLSGGIDSSLTAALCVRALGSDKVLGVIMPTSFTPKEDLEDAFELARMLNIKTLLVNIDEICEAFVRSLNIDPEDTRIRIPLANIRARVRMIILYFYANLYNYLVVGTSDKSEYLIGFFTKYGDGAADFFPIRHLYKTQVRELASYLGLPERIVRKPSSPQLYPGHKLSDELPVDYPVIDLILVGLFEMNLPADKVSEEIGVPLEIVNNVLHRYLRSIHKRAGPPMVEVKNKRILELNAELRCYL
ncbi:NAD+ synthase [Candidatus Bathyarchaeota archaeon]|nr:NAD+ synthase [Candidatus Bathyarchaeota archaeon]